MYVILSASPNKDGLTAACCKKVCAGIEKAGGEAEPIDLSALLIEPCRVCGNGWGVCWENGGCVIQDGLQGILDQLRNAEGMVLVTPVYWGEASERMKYFCDRARRIEATRKSGSRLAGKQVALIAAAGGSGNGTVSCLRELEEWCAAVGAIPQERIGVTRFNRGYMLEVIEDLGSRMVRGEYFKGWS